MPDTRRGSLTSIPKGDLLLFLFLLAGAIGGFIIGYTFRGLFPPRKRTAKKVPRTK